MYKIPLENYDDLRKGPRGHGQREMQVHVFRPWPLLTHKIKICFLSNMNLEDFRPRL